jgi:hypothetical protein
MRHASLLFALTLSVSALAVPFRPQPELINGTVVPAGERPDVVSIRTGSSGCTASVVGKRVALTAAHCVSTNSTSTFTTAGKSYSGKSQMSKLYPAKNHDVAVLILTADVDLGGKPFSVVGGTAAVGKEITLLGYGCTAVGGGSTDGKLRTGKATITSFSGYHIVSKNGSALCYGDSGGPDYIDDAGVMKQISVNSMGNISTTNYTTRLDSPESKAFFDDVIAQHKVEICGVNADCGAPKPPDSFTLTNAAGELTFKSAGLHELEYVKNVFQQAMNFLAGL